MKRLSMNFKNLFLAVTVFTPFWSPVANAQTGFFCTTNTVPITFKVDGSLAGFTGSLGDSNVSFGYKALSNNAFMGNANVAIGIEALSNNTYGKGNTATGSEALFTNQTGSWNTATGSQALYYNTGSYNTANGFFALYSNISGHYNTANGYQALNNNTTGPYNTAVGYRTLYSNKAGSDNTATGSFALYYNTAHANTANGCSSLSNNTTGSGNTANGAYSLYCNMTGSYNTSIGHFTLSNNQTGNYNTAIGCEADIEASNLTNSTAIGYGALASASNQIVLGNYTVSSVGGAVTWSTTSDGRAKKNIRAEVPGLSFIKQLQPVMYNMNLDALDELQKSDDPRIIALRDSVRNARSPELKEIEAKSKAKKEKIVYSGFIAQDVEKAAQSIGYDFNGVDAPENGKGPYGLRYAEFVVPLVKAVQELCEQNEAKDNVIAALQEQLKELTSLVYRLLEKENIPDVQINESNNAPTELPESIVEGASLQQNIPNPYNQSTVIRYTLPQACHSAKIVIFNSSTGGVIRQIPLSASGGATDSITVEGSSLPVGVCFYSLYVNNKLIDTKKMLLTE